MSENSRSSGLNNLFINSLIETISVIHDRFDLMESLQDLLLGWPFRSRKGALTNSCVKLGLLLIEPVGVV